MHSTYLHSYSIYFSGLFFTSYFDNRTPLCFVCSSHHSSSVFTSVTIESIFSSNIIPKNPSPSHLRGRLKNIHSYHIAFNHHSKSRSTSPNSFQKFHIQVSPTSQHSTPLHQSPDNISSSFSSGKKKGSHTPHPHPLLSVI